MLTKKIILLFGYRDIETTKFNNKALEIILRNDIDKCIHFTEYQYFYSLRLENPVKQFPNEIFSDDLDLHFISIKETEIEKYRDNYLSESILFFLDELIKNKDDETDIFVKLILLYDDNEDLNNILKTENENEKIVNKIIKFKTVNDIIDEMIFLQHCK